MQSCTSDLNLSINNSCLILTFKYNNLKITVSVRVWRKGSVCPRISGWVRGWATLWIKALNKSAVTQSLTSSGSQLALAVIGWHSNWTLLPSWIYHLNSCWPQHAMVVDARFYPAIGCCVLCGPEGLSSSRRSRCWFIFSRWLSFCKQRCQWVKILCTLTSSSSTGGCGPRGVSPHLLDCVLHCQLLPGHSQFYSN